MAPGARTVLPIAPKIGTPHALKGRKNLRRILAWAMQSETVMRGFITEQHFEQAEVEFPGIRAVYNACPCNDRPRTFVELLARYLRAMSILPACSASQSQPA